MADNLAVTQGTGTTIATDDVGGVHYQKVKLQLGRENVAGTMINLPVAAGTSGSNNTLVAAVAGKQIAVVQLALMASGQVNVKFQSAQATDKSGLFYLDTRGGLVLPLSEHGWMETNVGEALTLNLSAAVAVGGIIGYITY